MKKMVLLVVALLAAPLGVLAVPATASAAVCQGNFKTLDVAVPQSDSIVTGRVLAVPKSDALVKGTSVRARAVTVKVTNTLKGSASGRIKVHVVERTCGATQLRKGKTYLLFLTRNGNDWNNPNDMPNTAQDVSATVARVQEILNPTPAETPTVTFSDPLLDAPRPYWQVALPGFALVALSLIGFVVLLATRRRRAS